MDRRQSRGVIRQANGRSMNIVALTCLAMDIYVEQNLECVGGNAWNVATQCKRSGAEDISVVGAVGEDEYGDAILRHLTTTGIDARHVYREPGATATHRLLLRAGERQEAPGLWRGGVFDTFRLSDADWEFVNRHAAVAMGAFDPNFEGAVRHLSPHCKLAADFRDTGDFGHLERHVQRIALAVMSGTREDIERARAVSAGHEILVLVTLGAEGSVVLCRGEECSQPALPADPVVDTTGCGDAFEGAFLVSWLRDQNVPQALQLGARAAQQTLTHWGGVWNGPS